MYNFIFSMTIPHIVCWSIAIGVSASATGECREYFPTRILTTGDFPQQNVRRENKDCWERWGNLSFLFFSCKIKWPKSEKKMESGVGEVSTTDFVPLSEKFLAAPWLLVQKFSPVALKLWIRPCRLPRNLDIRNVQIPAKLLYNKKWRDLPVFNLS